VYRRAISEDTLLWPAADDGASATPGVYSQPQAGAAVDAGDGAASNLSQATDNGGGCRAAEVSLSAAQSPGRASQPGMGHRHHLCAAGARVHVPGRHHGLVQSLCADLGTLEHAGWPLLPGCTGDGADNRLPGHLQQRPGRPVHGAGFHYSTGARRHSDQHGWSGARI